MGLEKILPYANSKKATDNAQDISELSAGQYYYSGTWTLGEINPTGGVELVNNKRVRTDFINVRKGTLVKFLQYTDKAGFYVFWYDLNKTYISYKSWCCEWRADKDYYIRLVSKYSNNRDITDVTAFNNLVLIDINQTGLSLTKPYVYGDFTKLYRSDAYVDAMVGASITASTITDVYAAWDAFMAEHTDCITRSYLGSGSTNTGSIDGTLPMYAYTIAASTDVNNTLLPAPEVLISTAVHGNEKSMVWSTLAFFKQMFAKLATDETMAALKSNVTFKILPVVNPGGYNDNTRNTRHKVNLNRNFSFMFSSQTDTDKGAAPYSERETVILRDWLTTNKNALIYIDFHRDIETLEYFGYINTPNTDIQRIYSTMMRRLSEAWHNDVLSTWTENRAYGKINNDQWATTFNEAYYYTGIQYSSLLEEVSIYASEVEYCDEIVEMGVDLLANFIFALLDFISK